MLKWGIRVSIPLGTGYTNMKNRTQLIQVQDSIWESKKYLPGRLDDGREVTYCNLAVQAVLNAYGYHYLDAHLADAMMIVMRKSDDFKAVPVADCQFMANRGTVVVAGLDSRQLKQGAGHVCTLTPGEEEWSGHWNCRVPVCLSIGREGINFRTKGVNWAFRDMPEFYAWVPSL